jgi:alpha-1,2-mannosyltransferase
VFYAGDPTRGAVATPVFLFLFWPWIALPGVVAVLSWTALELAAVAALLWVVYRALGRPVAAELLAVLALVLLFPPLRDSFQEGQISVFIGLAAALALLGHQRRRPLLGGAALGLAIGIKLTPALILVYFAWKRDWRLVGAAVGVALALAVATLGAGWAGYWPGFLTITGELGRGTANLLNQSLDGFLLRWFLPAWSGSPIAPPPLAFSAGLALAQVATAGGLVAILRRMRGPRREVEWAELSAVLLVAPLLQPFAWPHHFAQALVAIPVGVRLVRMGMLGRAPAAVLAAAYVALLLFGFPLFVAARAVDPGSLPGQPLLELGGSLLMLTAVVAAAVFAWARPPVAGTPP